MEVVWKKCCPDGTCGAGADGVSEPLEVEVAAIVGVTWLRRPRSSLPRHTMIKAPENTMFWRQWQKQQKWKINTAMKIDKSWSHWMEEIRVKYLNHSMFSTSVAAIAMHCRSHLAEETKIKSPENTMFWRQSEKQQKWKLNTAMKINKTWSHWMVEIRVNSLNHTMFSTFVICRCHWNALSESLGIKTP